MTQYIPLLHLGGMGRREGVPAGHVGWGPWQPAPERFQLCTEKRNSSL